MLVGYLLPLSCIFFINNQYISSINNNNNNEIRKWVKNWRVTYIERLIS